MDRELNSRYKMAVVHFPNESAVMMKTQAYFRKVTPLMLILFICSFERQGYRSGNFRTRNSYSKYNDFIERFRVTRTLRQTANVNLYHATKFSLYMSFTVLFFCKKKVVYLHP